MSELDKQIFELLIEIKIHYQRMLWRSRESNDISSLLYYSMKLAETIVNIESIDEKLKKKQAISKS